MEISKDELIFQSIDKQYDIKEDNDWIINIKSTSLWTENEFINFLNVMKNYGYNEKIDEEVLEISNNENILKIYKIKNIIKYCSTESLNDLDYQWTKKKIISTENINNLFDADITLSLENNTNNIEQDNWNELKKKYKIIKKFSYTDIKKDIIYIAKIVKESNDEYINLKKSGVINSSQKYEFEIILKEKDDVISSIVKIIQSINLSNIILTKIQQKDILNQYYDLIKNDIKINKYNTEIPLLTPKPITLERANLINPSEYGAISILSGYTVTEKADGERLLLYINKKGNCYLINSSYRIEDTGMIASKEVYNSLIDGEYILCNKRKDIHKKNIFAAFDIYFINNKKITDLPLIDKNKCRYNELKSVPDNIDISKSTIEFIVKTHYYSDNILNDNKKILESVNSYPYEVDGLIFTPANLPLYSYYPSKPVEITDNMKWERVFKWKPEEQNTIDFLIKEEKDVIINGLKHKELSLWVGYNVSQWEDINPEKGLRLRYDKNYSKQQRQEGNKYIPKLFKPSIYYHSKVDKSFIRINSKNEIRAENNDKIENESIVEFRYNLSKKEWIPIRVREDKTRIFNKGILSKTANDYSVALNIWRSIHSPVSTSMIIGNQDVYSKEAQDELEDRILDTDDIYYAREIPRESLLSVHMLNFHNQGIKKLLYSKPPIKGSLLELACGQGGDMSRWIDNNYKFVLGVDLVRNNIYNPRSGAYSRMIKRKNQFFRKMESTEKIFLTDMVFVVGDCSKSIKDGTSASSVNDKESENILKIVMNRHKSVPDYYKYIVGKGSDGFNAVSCMFAIHYFFESEEKLDGFLNNVSMNLKKGGIFFCTFMDGKSVIDAINANGGNMVEGRKTLNDIYNIPVWAIIRRYNKDEDDVKYNRKIDVYIENTQKLISEYVVNYEFLINKAREFGLIIKESEMFSETFNKLKENISTDENVKTHLDEDLLALDKDEIQKQFSFLNRWVIFEKR